MAAQKRLENIGGLWLSKTKKGEIMLSGTIKLPNGDSLQVEIYPNQFKTSDEQKKPDMIVYTNAEIFEIARAMYDVPVATKPPF